MKEKLVKVLVKCLLHKELLFPEEISTLDKFEFELEESKEGLVAEEDRILVGEMSE